MVSKCPKCGSPRIEESLTYAWFLKCPDCGFFTDDHKRGPANAPFKRDPHWDDPCFKN